MTDAIDENPVAVFLPDEHAMICFGQNLAVRLDEVMLITLKGDLGAGKTTLCRGLLRGLGHQGAVKSPTYTIVEPYDLAFGMVYHFDLYRVNDPQELDYIGFTDYLDNGALNIVEWPERGREYLSKIDVHLSIEHRSSGRSVILESRSEAGKKFIEGFVDCRFFIDHAMID